MPAVVFAALYAQANEQKKIAEHNALVAAQQSKRISKMRDDALQTVEWVFNNTARLPYDTGMDAATEELLTGLLERLKKSGFSGRIVFRAHQGNFVRIFSKEREFLASDELVRRMRKGEELTGYSREYSLALGQRFAESVKRIATKVGFPDEMIHTLSYGKEQDKYPYPAEREKNIDEWNRVAYLNNRVEIKLEGVSGFTLP